MDRSEWNFERCQDDLVAYCYAYEYGRESISVRSAFEKSVQSPVSAHNNIAHESNGSFDEHGNWHYVFGIRPNSPSENILTVVIDAPPGFPDTPYLRLEHRESTLGRGRPFRPRDPVKLAIVQPDGRFMTHDQSEPIVARVSISDPAMPIRIRPDAWRVDELVCLHIDLEAKAGTILESFKKILLDLQNHSETKRNRQLSTMRSYLKALGVFRLSKHFGTTERAIEYVRSAEGSTAGLYANAGEWSEAKKLCERIIRDFDNHVPVEYEKTYFPKSVVKAGGDE